VLRDVRAADIPIFFEQQRDPQANHMAAFAAADPNDRDAFDAHWKRIVADERIVKQTIDVAGEVAGHILSFVQFGKQSVGYWLGREYWGRGIASAALREFLPMIDVRPVYARVAQDNAGSLRVLQKCGFVICGEDRGFSNARSVDVPEFLLMLSPPVSAGR
jgi:RimJ/RimL family protein N-acetyltransferase